KRPSRSHPMVPGNVMKPQQKLFRTRVKRAEKLPQWRGILRDSVAPARTAIETHAGVICAMKVNRVPIVALFLVPPGRRTVVMATPEKMMQSKGCHVINYCFM